MTLTKVTCNLHITKSRAQHLVLPHLSDQLQLITFDHSILFHTFSSHSFQDTTLTVFLPPWLFLLSLFFLTSQCYRVFLFFTHIRVTCNDLMYSLDSKYRHKAPSHVFPAQSSFLNSRLRYLTAYLTPPLECL